MPEQTPEQWAEFIAEAESQQVAQQARMQEILNGSYSDAEKQAAVHDYILQSDYLSWVKSKYAEYSQTGVLPADMTYRCNLSGNVYRYFKEGSTSEYEYKLLELGFPPYADTNEHEIAHMQPAEVRTFDLIKSPDLTLQLKVTAGSWADPIINYKYYTGAYSGVGIFTDNYQRTTFEILASGRWASDVSYAPSSSTDGNRNYYKIGYTWGAGFAYIPTWGMWTSALWGPKSYGPSGSDNTDGVVAQQVTSVQKSGTVDTPWDFYNDDILPEVDSNNAFFPDGYNPVSPDDPPDEQTNLPHDDGTPSEQQTDRSVGVPSQFITQYLLTYEELNTVGANLWQTWLTPNTDVWMNFFLPYRQDFGTLNIGACLDFIISLRVYPFDFTNYLDLFVQSSGLYMGTGHTDFLGTSCLITRKLFHAFDCGTCEVKPETPYNDFRDMYNTSVLLFLPYCGTVELNPAEVMYRTIRAYYYVDFQSGACTAVVEVQGDKGWYMIASKTGQIGFLLPMTATNAGQLSAQFGKDATETVGTLSGLFFDVANSIAQSAENVAKVLAFNKAQKDVSNKKDVPFGTTVTQSLEIGQSGVNTALSLANQKLDRLSRSGVQMPMLSGGAGAESLMFPDTPFVQIRRGKYAKPDNYPHSQGFLNGSSNLISYYKGAFKGSPTIDPSYKGRGLCKFTGVDSTGLTCNNDERVEIINLLESGVYL